MDRSCNDKVHDMLKDAKKTMNKGQTTLVNVLVGRTNFRDGSISV